MVGAECLLVEGPVEAQVVWGSWMTGPPVDLSSTALDPPGPTLASVGLGPHLIHGWTQGLGPFPQCQSWVLASTVPVPPIWRHFVKLCS